MALLTMVGELRLAQWVEFKPRISPLRWTRPRPSMVLFEYPLAHREFYMMHVARCRQSSVSSSELHH